MSSFENYSRTSRHYDETRIPVGGALILDCLARLSRPSAELVVLDAGCGTGAYAETILDSVKRVTVLDMNAGMLAIARQKLSCAEGDGRISFTRGSVTALPFRDASFDAVMINQVVHHLGDTPDNEFATLRRVIGEFARVLRPGGGLVFNHCSQAQLREAYWYAALIPEAVERCCRRFAPLETVRRVMAEQGFRYHGCSVPHDAVCQGEAYFDGQGPLREAWRAGDSIWAQVEPDELTAAQERIRRLEAAGQLSAFVAEHDARRPALGQITILFATKD